MVVAASLAAIGCPRESAPGRPVAGTERGDCRSNRGCDPGLLCLSNLCVRPPPADCQAIADQLASIDLGNYAEPDARAPVVATYKANCDRGLVSKEQGACLEKATDKWAAAQCAPSMFPELASTKAVDCGAVAAKLRTAMSRTLGDVPDAQTQKMLTTVLGVMQQSCEQDAWPDLAKKCVLLAADTADAMQACNAQLPPDLQQKISTRMAEAMRQP